MPRFLASLVVPLGLALSGGLAVLVNQSRPDPGMVYSVAALRANLRHDSSAWVGRPMLVRGILVGCLHLVCQGHEPYAPPCLIDATQAATADPLRVAWGGSDAVSAFLRGVPMLGRLVSRP